MKPTMFPISQHATRCCLIDGNPEQLKQRDQLARMMVVEDQWLEMGPIFTRLRNSMSDRKAGMKALK
jgi:hypothetical protein